MKQLLKTTLILATLCGGPSFAFSAEVDPAVLSLSDKLESAIYLQEAKADYESAAAVFRQILASTEFVESLAAEAQYRLATCYFEQGNTEQAMLEYAKIVSSYPEELEWVSAAKERLPKALEPKTTPWEDGERCHYDWHLPDGRKIGTSVATIQRYTREGRPLWRKETLYLLNGRRMLAVEFDPETFRSTYSEMIAESPGTLRCWYDESSAKVEYEQNDTKREFALDGTVYDNEQAYELMRQMPLEIGYSMEISIFVPMSGVSIPAVFEIKDIVERETALGRFDCYSVELSLPGPKQVFYFKADESRVLVGFEVGGIEARVSKIEVSSPGTWKTYQDPKYSFVLDLPDEWFAVEDLQAQREDSSNTYLLEPSVSGGYSLYSAPTSSFSDEERASAETMVRNSAMKFGDSAKSLKLDEDSLERFESNGMAVACVSGTYQSPQGTSLTYRAFALVGAERTFVFSAHVNSNRFEEVAETIERIAHSVRTR